MSDLSQIVDSLENRINKLLFKYKEQQQKYTILEQELAQIKEEQSKLQLDVAMWKEKCRALKLSNSILGGDQYKRDTKLKINALVREIDQCIHQLSE